MLVGWLLHLTLRFGLLPTRYVAGWNMGKVQSSGLTMARRASHLRSRLYLRSNRNVGTSSSRALPLRLVQHGSSGISITGYHRRSTNQTLRAVR